MPRYTTQTTRTCAGGLPGCRLRVFVILFRQRIQQCGTRWFACFIDLPHGCLGGRSLSSTVVQISTAVIASSYRRLPVRSASSFLSRRRRFEQTVFTEPGSFRFGKLWMKCSSSSSLKSSPRPFTFTISLSPPSAMSVRVHVAVARRRVNTRRRFLSAVFYFPVGSH